MLILSALLLLDCFFRRGAVVIRRREESLLGLFEWLQPSYLRERFFTDVPGLPPSIEDPGDEGE